MPEQYHDELDQEVQQASSGGGMVCQVAVYGAFQVYTSLPPAERIFLYGGALKKDDAKTKADALADSAGAKVEQTLCTLQYKDSVLGRDVSHWKGDRYHTYGPTWAPDAQEFNRLRVEHGLKSATKTWVRLGSIPSPNAEQNKEKSWAWEENKDGEKVLKSLRLPVAVFASKSDAEAAAASSASASTVDDPSWPGASSEWPKYDDWVSTGKPMILEMAGDGKPVPAIAAACACSIEQVKFVLSEPTS